jgi:hypothetical protein
MARLLIDEVLDVPVDGAERDEFQRLVDKATGELAMLLRLAKRALPEEADAEEIRALARRIAPFARAPHVRRTLLLRPSRAPNHALAHFCLVDLGVSDDEMDRLARLALHSSVCDANERVPYRMLDAAWTRHLAFGVGELNHPAIALSPLGVGVDLLNASIEDAYAFTHALIYATDFGRIPLPHTLDRQSLLGIAEALAVKAMDEDDLDLLAEVLMAPAILRLDWTPTLTFAWSVLTRVWNAFGFVPGPGLPPAPTNEHRTQAIRRVLGTVYHTTFAAGLCCATLVASGSSPTEPPAGTAGGIEPPPGNGSAWRINWSACSRQGQEDLAFLVFAFSLRRAIDAVDLVGVRDVLMAFAKTALVEHPLFTQSLELLERAKASA